MEDFASAAARHWDNVEFLAAAARWQEAAYLAGYIAECSLKALLQVTQPTVSVRDLGHDLPALSGDALEMAVVLNRASRRYPVPIAVPGTGGLSQWKPEHRYERTAFLPESEFRAMVAQAERIGQSVLVQLVLDGVVEDVPL